MGLLFLVLRVRSRKPVGGMLSILDRREAFGSMRYIAYDDDIERMMHVGFTQGQQRSEIHCGQEVDIVLKEDQATGALTRGIVKDILTNSSTHPHGIKVRLQDGQVGRVKVVLGK